MVFGSVGSAYALGVTVNKAVPLILVALSFSVAARARQINVGIEGQLYAGATAATVVATQLAGPVHLHLLVAILAGALGGALWALIPALLRVGHGVNEIVSSLLLNYVAIFLTSFLLAGPLRDPSRAFPESYRIPASASFPVLLPGTIMSASIVLVLVLAGALYLVLRWTAVGFEIRCVGANPRAARLVGINVSRVVLTAFLLSGAIGGLAGTCEVLGNQHRFVEHFSDSGGYLGIMVALLGGLSPLGGVVAGLGFAMVSTGADQMQRVLGIPSALALVIEGTAVLVYLVGCYLSALTPCPSGRRLAVRGLGWRRAGTLATSRGDRLG
jgi:simple sugar transport system permease protein